MKTGEHSNTALGQALPPCKPVVCPNEGTGPDREGVFGEGVTRL
jgi:hypothetical protein